MDDPRQKGKMVANPSKLNPNAKSFYPRDQLPCNQRPHHQLPRSYIHPNLPPPSYSFPRSLQEPDLYQTYYPSTSHRPTGYQIPHDFNHSPARNDPRISLLPAPTTPLSSHLNTNTSKPPVHTPISTTPTATLSTSTTICGSSPSVDGLVKGTPKVANPSNLQATDTPFDQLDQLPSDHDPHLQWGHNPPPNQQLRPSYTNARSLQGPDIYPSSSPRPTGYQMAHDFDQAPAANDPRISLLPTTPPSSQLNTNTSQPPVHTPIGYQIPQLSTPRMPAVGSDEEFPPLSHQIQRRRDVCKLTPAKKPSASYVPSATTFATTFVPAASSVSKLHRRKKKNSRFRPRRFEKL